MLLLGRLLALLSALPKASHPNLASRATGQVTLQASIASAPTPSLPRPAVAAASRPPPCALPSSSAAAPAPSPSGASPKSLHGTHLTLTATSEPGFAQPPTSDLTTDETTFVGILVGCTLVCLFVVVVISGIVYCHCVLQEAKPQKPTRKALQSDDSLAARALAAARRLETSDGFPEPPLGAPSFPAAAASGASTGTVSHSYSVTSTQQGQEPGSKQFNSRMPEYPEWAPAGI